MSCQSRKITLPLAQENYKSKMNPKQLQVFQFDFDKADKDKSGSLSFSEVYKVLQAQGFAGSEAEAMGIFQNMDRDKNKSVSRAEFTEAIKNMPKMTSVGIGLRRIFREMDKDNSGYLTKDEISAVATGNQGMGFDLPKEKLAEMLSCLKTDDNKKMSYHEFLCLFNTELAAVELRRIFNTMDKDKSGHLTKDEMVKAVKTDPEMKTESIKITGLIESLKTDADNKISYEEFVKFWCKHK